MTHRGLMWAGAVLVPVFVVASGFARIALIWPNLGIDAVIYVHAARVWLAGGDPWMWGGLGLRFGAPPPTLIPLIPFALAPEPVGAAVMVGVCAGAAVWCVRRLRLPWWWLFFVPLVDGVWGGNPDVLLFACLLGGLPALAVFWKLYAAVPLLVWRRWRDLAVTGVLLAVTFPFLPWGQYLAAYPIIGESFAIQGPGYSAWAVPILVLPTVIALLSLPREEAGWLAVPGLWSWTGMHYSTMAMATRSSLIAVVIVMVAPGWHAAVVICYAAARQLEGRLAGLPQLDRLQPDRVDGVTSPPAA